MKCKTESCNNKAANNRNICNTCKSTKYALDHPIEYSFNNLRKNAKRRGKVFLLTLDQFKEFCIKTDYIVGKGISKDSYHIDRIDEEGAYELSNIQILTNSENKKKNLIWIADRNGKSSFKVEIVKEYIVTNLPF